MTGRRWIGPTAEEDRLGLAIAQAAGVPEIVGRILARRGVPAIEAAAYLAPALRDLMPDPSRLRDMDRAAARFWAAVKGRRADRGLRRLRRRRRRLGGAGAGLAAADGPERDALRAGPDRRGLRAERAGDAGARGGARPDRLRGLRHAQPRADRRGGLRRDRARPPSRRRDAAAGGGGGEPEPAGRGRQPRVPLRGGGGVPDAGGGQPADARPKGWRGRICSGCSTSWRSPRWRTWRRSSG